MLLGVEEVAFSLFRAKLGAHNYDLGIMSSECSSMIYRMTHEKLVRYPHGADN